MGMAAEAQGVEGVCRWKAEVEWQLKIGVEEERALSLARSLSLPDRTQASIYSLSQRQLLYQTGQIELAQAGGERPFLVRSRPAGKSLNFFSHRENKVTLT